MKKLFVLTCSIILVLTFSGCGATSDIQNNSIAEPPVGEDADSNDTEDGYFRETAISANGEHTIKTFVTRDKGIGILVDGLRCDYDDLSIRFSPQINNKGQWAFAQQTPGSGYDIMLNDSSILHSGACLDYLRMSEKDGIFVESDNGQRLTRVYVFNIESRSCECVVYLSEEFIEETCVYADNQFGLITSYYDGQGYKFYNCYIIDGANKTVTTFVSGSNNLLSFPNQDVNDDVLVLDSIEISNNDRYYYNALRLEWGGWNEAFAHGNDFRGRLSWSESERLRGLCELYRKTPSDELLERITGVAEGILDVRNAYVGVHDEWNPDFLWTSKAYSINNASVSIMVENSEILSSLLYACNEGLFSRDTKIYSEIIESAEQAIDYYEQWYSDGHYSLPYGYPMVNDGIVVPWNFQNSLAEVALDLYFETGKQKYLNKAEELIGSFINEWIESEDRIIWHYWPSSYYNGWTDDGRSINTPQNKPSEDNLYEDAAHAGISVRLLCRYYNYFPDGLISSEQIEKIQNNMSFFCFENGFSRFISGDEDYVPRAWHYWVSPYFAQLHNEKFEKYVCQGYLHCFPEWDSQESLFAYARYYNSETHSSGIVITRMRIYSNEKYTDEQIDVDVIELRSFIHDNYPSSMQ